MKKIEDLNYYELLEISTDASSQDIHRAYERIRKTYEPNSIALYSLFSADETASINQRIEDAYRTLVYEEPRKRYDALLRQNLMTPAPVALPPVEKRYQMQPVQPSLSLEADNRYLKSTEPPPAPPVTTTPQPLPPTITEFTGSVLKMLREQRNITTRAIADMTKLSTRYVDFIEAENFGKLPARPYLRGFLVLYAKALGYEPERLANDYMKRYDAAMNPPKQK